MDDRAFFEVCPSFDPRMRILRAEALAHVNRVITTWALHKYGRDGGGRRGENSTTPPAALWWQLIPYGSYAMGLDTETSDIDCCFVTDRAKLICNDFFSSLQEAFCTYGEYRAESNSFYSSCRVISSKVILSKSPLLNLAVELIDEEEGADQKGGHQSYVVEFDLAFYNMAFDAVGSFSPKLYSRSWHGVLCARELLRFATEEVRGGSTCSCSSSSTSSYSLLFSFVHCIRFLKQWAIARGIYNSKLGYFGGIHLAVMFLAATAEMGDFSINSSSSSCFCSSSSLIQKVAHFFRFYSRAGGWRWPSPVRLSKYYWKGDHEDVVWNPVVNPSHRRHVMPVLTPVYPFTNIFFAATKGSMSAMQIEIERAASIFENIVENSGSNSREGGAIVDEKEGLHPSSPQPQLLLLLSSVMEPYPKKKAAGLRVYIYYTCIGQDSFLFGASEQHVRDLAGFVESRVYKLAQRLEESPYISTARPVVVSKDSTWCIHISRSSSSCLATASTETKGGNKGKVTEEAAEDYEEVERGSSPDSMALQQTIFVSTEWWKKRVLDKAGIADSSRHHIRVTLAGSLSL